MGRRAAEGFTLIEVLIVMTLLSIMVVLLFASMKICAGSWEKGEAKIEAVNEVAVVYNFFQRHLTVAKPLWNDFAVSDERTFAFQGNVQTLQFVSDFPASAGRAGAQLFSLQLEEVDQQRNIEVTITPFFPAADGQELTKDKVTLVKHVSEFSMAYFGVDENTGQAAWQDHWLDRDVQPQLVKINIALDNGVYWPEMIIPLKVASSSDNGEGAFDESGTDDETNAPTSPEEDSGMLESSDGVNQ